MEKTEEIIENGKSRDTGNILQKTYTQKKKITNIKPGMNPDAREGKQFLLLTRHPPCY